MSEKYSVHDYTVEQILNFINSNEIAITGIRTFVWNGKQKRTAWCFQRFGLRD